MNIRLHQHPDRDQLSAFALGTLFSSDIDEIGEHLANCDVCSQAVKSVPNDTFLHLVRECETMLDTNAIPLSVPPSPPGGEGPGVRGDQTAALPASTPPVSAANTNGETVDASAINHGHDTFQLDPSLADHPRYHIVDLLGAGGMGAVYKAEHRLMHRTVALKVINPQLVANKTAVERFHREVQAAARLQHPNIVTAYDAETAGDAHFLVMEYVAGADLSQVLKEKGPLPVAEACEYVRQTALGLQHAHERGMAHRDIKPQNLMRTPDGQVKILDFGLAALTGMESQSTALTARGTIMGTPDYMAPEQARDAASADIRADIYSLGCTLYCLLAGRTPFEGSTAMDKIVAHMQREPRPVTEFRKNVPAELLQVLRKMMAKDREQRYQTPAEVAAALAPFANASPLPGTPGRGAGGEGKRRRWPLVAAAAVLAAMIAAAVIYLQTSNGSTIRIDIRDPQIKLSIAGDVYTFANKGDTIRVTPGEHTLMVERGDLKFPTRKFTLGPGQHPSLVVELLDENIVVVKLGDRVLGQEALPQQNAAKWHVVDPFKDSTVDHKGDRVTFKLPGKQRGMYATSISRNTDAPRLMQSIEGDFDLQAKLLPLPTPQGNAAVGQGSAIIAAGLLLWQDEENFVRLFEQRVGNGKTLVTLSDLIGGEYANHPLIKSHVVSDASKPVDLRIDRRGNVVTGYVREDGGEWSKIGSVTTKFPGKVDAGVCAMISQKVGAEVEFTDLTLSKQWRRGDALETPGTDPKDLLRDAVLLMNFEMDTFYEKDGKTWVRDLSGRGNDARLENARPITDGAVSIDSNGVLHLSKAPIAVGKPFTVAAWIKRDQPWEADSPLVFSQSNNDGKSELSAGVGMVDGYWMMNLTCPPNPVMVKGPFAVGAPENLTFAKSDWGFVAWTRDDAGKLTFTTDKTTKPYHLTHNMKDGPYDHAELGRGLKGRLDQVVILNRALSAGELLGLEKAKISMTGICQSTQHAGE